MVISGFQVSSMAVAITMAVIDLEKMGVGEERKREGMAISGRRAAGEGKGNQRPRWPVVERSRKPRRRRLPARWHRARAAVRPRVGPTCQSERGGSQGVQRLGLEMGRSADG
jgi:hypothetical protein